MLAPAFQCARQSYPFPRLILCGSPWLLILFLVASVLAAQQDKVAPALELNKPIERELAGGEFHSYLITLKSGQYVHIVVDQSGINVEAILLDPNGKKIVEVNSPNGRQGPKPIFAIVASSGTYRLEVRSLDKDVPPGRYEVKIEELRTATEQDKSRIAAESIFVQAELLRGQQTAESLQNAIKKYEEALLLFRASGDRKGEATTLTTIGFVYSSLGQRQKTLQYFELALPVIREIGDKKNEAEMLSNIGFLYSNFGDKQNALRFYEQALPVQRAINEKYGEAVTRHNIGKVYSDLGEWQNALQYYQQALILRREVKDKKGEALTLVGLGLVYRDIGEWQNALQYYDQALQLSKGSNDQIGEAATLQGIGLVYQDLGEHRKALQYLEQALSVQKKVQDKQGENIILESIGLTYEYLDEYQKALQYYEQALPYFRTIRDRNREAEALGNIGSVYLNLSQPQKALQYYEQCLSISRAIGARVREGIALNNLGVICQYLGEDQRALEYFQQSLLLSRAVNDRRGEARTLANLMTFWDQLKNPGFAIFYGKQAIKVHQDLRLNIQSLDRSIQQTFLKTVINPYRTLAELLISQDRLSEAHQIINRFRDQEFYDYSSKKGSSMGSLNVEPLKVELTPREAQAEQQLQNALQRIDSLSQRLDNLDRQTRIRKLTEAEGEQKQTLQEGLKTETEGLKILLQNLESEFKQTDSSKGVQSIDTSEMQQALRDLGQQNKQKVVAIYTLINKDNFHILLITPDEIMSVSAPGKGGEVNNKALQLWGLLQSNSYDPTLLSGDLYNIVFKPIKDKLPKDTKTIMWSLDGNLRYIPTAALYDGKQYLVERYDQVVFTRANKERITREVSRNWTGYGFATSAPHKVELLGDVIEFGPLDFVKDEMRIFRNNTNPEGIIDGDVFPDSSFNKSSLITSLKQKRPLVHISSHFSFRPGDESRSFLLLGDGSVMTLSEMKRQEDLFQGVELLTLSACNTAAQRPDATGREIDGFAELVQRLGAGGVIASLWEVKDNSTAVLMKHFYKDRQGGKYTKAGALRRAQIDLLYGRNETKLPASLVTDPAASINQSNDLSRKGSTTTEDIIVDAKYRVPFKPDKKKPLAHPYYWSPFVLFGNWK